MVKKKKQAVKPIYGAIKTNGTRDYLESDIVSDAQWKAQMQDVDTRVWVLANTLSATSGAEQMMAKTMLNLFRKWGYKGSQTDTLVRCLKKYVYDQECLVNAMTPCYKDKTLQAITVGNLQSIFEDLIGMVVGITVDGEYCSCPCDIALIPKTLTPAIKGMPTADQIKWLGDMSDAAVKDGEEYMEHNHIERDKPEYKIEGQKIIKVKANV